MQIELISGGSPDLCRDSAARMLAAASRIRVITSQTVVLNDQPAKQSPANNTRRSGQRTAATLRGRPTRTVTGVQRSYREPVVPALEGDWSMAWE